jgi:hypothetical protein
MRNGDFVKEMQRTLQTQQEHEDLAVRNNFSGPVKPKDEEFDITNRAATMSVIVRSEPNGDLVYKGTAASGMFRAQIAGDELTYSWERTTPTPSMRVTFAPWE